MWTDNNPFEKSGAGGGFMSGATDSPAGGERQGKVRRAQNVFPCSIKQLKDFPSDTFSIEGFETNMVTIVGLVLKVDSTPTKVSMVLDDQTGTMECVYYIGTDEDNKNRGQAPTTLCEGSYGRIVGSVRKSKDAKYLVIFNSSAVTDLNEMNCHLLEVIQVGISLKKLREAENQKAMAGAHLDNTFSNSMIRPGLGGPTGTENSSQGGVPMIQGFSKNQNLIYRLIAASTNEQGMHRDEIINAARGALSVKEILETLDFLSNEGHLFSTLDEDHYKATDG